MPTCFRRKLCIYVYTLRYVCAYMYIQYLHSRRGGYIYLSTFLMREICIYIYTLWCKVYVSKCIYNTSIAATGRLSLVTVAVLGCPTNIRTYTFIRTHLYISIHSGVYVCVRQEGIMYIYTFNEGNMFICLHTPAYEIPPPP